MSGTEPKCPPKASSSLLTPEVSLQHPSSHHKTGDWQGRQRDWEGGRASLSRCLRRAKNGPYYTNEQHRPNGLAQKQDLEGRERREPAELSVHSRRLERGWSPR